MISSPEHGQSVTAIILTRDEALHIERCIHRLKDLADRIIVVDSGSIDDTRSLAEAAGAEVWLHPFKNYALQFQWALDELTQETGWIVRIDADEFFESAAIAAIRQRIRSSPDEVVGFDIRRKVVFRERWIRWGGYYDTVLTRVWRAGRARIEQRWMDEHIIVDEGQIERITAGDIVDENLKDITDWTTKHNSYTTRSMIDFIGREYPLMPAAREEGDLTRQAALKRFLRNDIYSRAPLYWRVFLYFLQRYVFRLGFLDGRQGLVFHTLQGFWNFFLVDAKIEEARTYIALHGLDAFRDHVRQRYGLMIEAPE